MTYLPVSDLKRSKVLWEGLGREGEFVVTRDGRPCAILVAVSPDTVETDLAAVRRALFSAAVSRGRERARAHPPSEATVAGWVRASRRARGAR
jgi:antitoxin (DNA-binding transcriptional repressor) of toxin-antitoxin stability system